MLRETGREERERWKERHGRRGRDGWTGRGGRRGLGERGLEVSVGGEAGREASSYIRRKLAMFILYIELRLGDGKGLGWGYGG